MIDALPRRTFIWLALIQSFLLLPHAVREPLLILPIWACAHFYWWKIYRTEWRYPNAWIKSAFVILGFVAVITIEARLSIEAAVGVLLVAFILKLLEVKTRRDVLLLVYLSYFTLTTELLFSQSILAGLYGLLGLWLLTAALVAVHQSAEGQSFYKPLNIAARLFAFSLPVMIVGFLVFPRLDPLWSMPQPSGKGKTGVGLSMSPGNISELVKSDELAFRVKFSGAIPEMKNLYWRGVVLSHFDGRTWSTIKAKPSGETLAVAEEGVSSIDYFVMMEPTYRKLLFPLDAIAKNSYRTEYFSDQTIRAKNSLDEREIFNFSAYIQSHAHYPEGRAQLIQSLQLPNGYNPKAIAFAKRLASETGTQQDYVDKVLQHFNQQAFYYTLKPDRLGKHSVDEFLFDTRRGFCEHYASSFAVLMRAANIPARVVIGYQGGELNQFADHVAIRQLDAHAWVEVWLDETGWQRVDPTYMVAPERIEQGSQASLSEEEDFLSNSPFSARNIQGVSWLTGLQHRFDQLNFLWNQAVLNYQGDAQQSLLRNLLGGYSIMRLMLLILGTFMTGAGLLFGFYYIKYRGPRAAPVQRYYQQLLKKIAKKGLLKQPNEGAWDFYLRCAPLIPEQGGALKQLTLQYQQLCYASPSLSQQDPSLLAQFKRDVMRFRLI